MKNLDNRAYHYDEISEDDEDIYDFHGSDDGMVARMRTPSKARQKFDREVQRLKVIYPFLPISLVKEKAKKWLRQNINEMSRRKDKARRNSQRKLDFMEEPTVHQFDRDRCLDVSGPFKKQPRTKKLEKVFKAQTSTSKSRSPHRNTKAISGRTATAKPARRKVMLGPKSTDDAMLTTTPSWRHSDKTSRPSHKLAKTKESDHLMSIATAHVGSKLPISAPVQESVGTKESGNVQRLRGQRNARAVKLNHLSTTTNGGSLSNVSITVVKPNLSRLAVTTDKMINRTSAIEYRRPTKSLKHLGSQATSSEKVSNWLTKDFTDEIHGSVVDDHDNDDDGFTRNTTQKQPRPTTVLGDQSYRQQELNSILKSNNSSRGQRNGPSRRVMFAVMEKDGASASEKSGVPSSGDDVAFLSASSSGDDVCPYVTRTSLLSQELEAVMSPGDNDAPRDVSSTDPESTLAEKIATDVDASVEDMRDGSGSPILAESIMFTDRSMPPRLVHPADGKRPTVSSETIVSPADDNSSQVHVSHRLVSVKGRAELCRTNHEDAKGICLEADVGGGDHGGATPKRPPPSMSRVSRKLVQPESVILSRPTERLNAKLSKVAIRNSLAGSVTRQQTKDAWGVELEKWKPTSHHLTKKVQRAQSKDVQHQHEIVDNYKGRRGQESEKSKPSVSQTNLDARSHDPDYGGPSSARGVQMPKHDSLKPRMQAVDDGGKTFRHPVKGNSSGIPLDVRQEINVESVIQFSNMQTSHLWAWLTSDSADSSTDSSAPSSSASNLASPGRGQGQFTVRDHQDWSPAARSVKSGGKQDAKRSKDITNRSQFDCHIRDVKVVESNLIANRVNTEQGDLCNMFSPANPKSKGGSIRRFLNTSAKPDSAQPKWEDGI